MSPRRIDTDVLVVGGGPAGAAAAIEVVAAGRSALLVEAAGGPTGKVCGEFVSPEAGPTLQALGVLSRVQSASPVRITHARFTAPGARAIRFALPGAQPALGISRQVLDEALRLRAREAGAALLRGVRFRAPIRGARGAVVGAMLDTPSGPLQVRSHLLIGADGRRSAVARGLGLEMRVGGTMHCAVKAHFEPGPGMRDLEGSVEIHLFPGGYVGMQPIEGDRINVSAVIEASAARDLGGGPLRLLRRASSRNEEAAARLRGSRPVGRALSLFPLERRRAAVAGEGFLLAGDAAQVVPPFSGEGIVAALRSGGLAGRAAAEALDRSDPSAAGLAGYRRARRRHLASPLRVIGLVERLVYRPALAGHLLDLLGRHPGWVQALVRATRFAA